VPARGHVSWPELHEHKAHSLALLLDDEVDGPVLIHLLQQATVRQSSVHLSDVLPYATYAAVLLAAAIAREVST
ncbi:hypothetical protein ACFRH4_39860, partial [Streptomyces mirabilis]|uniref:hypothetical protein n=1 Tax=Streptomyces mirabilis TaxID=68239 RepID=UPI0036BE3A07